MISAGAGAPAVVGQPITADQAAILNAQQPPTGGIAVGPNGTIERTAPMNPISEETYKGENALDRQFMKDINQDNQAFQKSMNWTNHISSWVNNVIQFGANIWASSIAWGAQESINDRRADAAENIATHEYEWRGKALDASERADDRMNAPGGLRDRERKDTLRNRREMYQDRLEFRERELALRNLDERFSYDNGSPSLSA